LIEKFKKEFDKPEYKNISRPEEANGLEQIIIYGTETLQSPTPAPFKLNPLPQPEPPATTGSVEGTP